MNKRAQASLTYRIVTEVLGLSLVLGAFSLGMVTDYTVPLLLRNLVLFAIVFSIYTAIWWRLSTMFATGILAGQTSAVVGMVVAFNIALAPIFLRLVISENLPIRELVAVLFTGSFIVVAILMAILVRRSYAYRFKARWRLIHHSLWLMSGLFLISLFIPLSFAPFVEISGRYLVWALALIVSAVFQRAAARFVANPAQPRPVGAQPSVQVASASTVPANSPHSSPSGDVVKEGKMSRDSHGRSQRHSRGRYRRSSGSRRRM